MEWFTLKPNAEFGVARCLAKPITAEITMRWKGKTYKFREGDYAYLFEARPRELGFAFMQKARFLDLFSNEGDSDNGARTPTGSAQSFLDSVVDSFSDGAVDPFRPVY